MMTENIQTKEVQCVEGLRMMLRGMALVFGTMAEGMGSEPAATAATAKAVEAEAKPTAEPTAKPKSTEQKTAGETADKADDKSDALMATDEPGAQKTTDKTAEAAVNAAPGGKQITRSLVERAMCAKIKELAVKGHGPDAVGTLFPMFHGATCVSDLTADDYPAFLAELAKL